MAYTFEQIAQHVDPVPPSIRVGALVARFLSERDLVLLPVVFDRTLVGTVSRQDALERVASSTSRAELLNQRLGSLLDETPVTVRADQRLGGFALKAAKSNSKAISRGVVVLSNGAYQGVVPAAALTAALAQENASRAAAQRDLSQALAEQERATNEAAEERSRLQAMLAHELRTPLHAAQASAELLQQGTVDGDSRQLARTIGQSCEAMDRLLADLMDFSRAGLSNLPVENEPVSVRRFAGELEPLWRPAAEDKGLDFSIEIPRLAAERVAADPVRLRQVLHNLISNAVKYTSQGQVVVRLQTVSVQDDLYLRAEVKDTGRGLTTDEVAEVFEPFRRLPSASNAPGTGLGLAISKAVTEQLGGELGYAANPDGGSVFHVNLPVRRAGPRMVAESRRSVRRMTFELGELLIVDDHEPSRRVLAHALKAAGWKVDAVHTLAQAQRRTAHKPYQAVLCDIHLSDGDGTALLQAIRDGSCGAPDTPVVAVTADRSEQRLQACRAAGFDAVWTKPLKPADAVTELADLIVAKTAASFANRQQSAIA